MKKIFLFVVLFIIGCSTGKKNISPPASETAKLNILSVNIGANPSYLNPLLFTDSTSHAVVRMVFNGLFKQDEDLKRRFLPAASTITSPPASKVMSPFWDINFTASLADPVISPELDTNKESLSLLRTEPDIK